MIRIDNILTGFVLTLGIFFGSFSLALAQGMDLEPNNTCGEAQDIGPITLPFQIDGSLDTPPEIPDVDFFKLSGEPGSTVRVDHEGQDTGKGTLPDPYLGFFDSDCNLLAENDDSGTLNSRLLFVIPANGIFILAATSCCDGTFTGQGGSSGTYQITVAPPPPAIGSISGSVVDALSGLPLRGDVPPFGSVELYRCSDGECFEFVAYQPTDSEGQFRFERDFADNPLEVGTYQVRAFANDFETSQTDPFAVGEREDFDVGELPLSGPPIQFSEIRPCGNLPPEGGRCRYSVRVTNNQSTAFLGQAWSLVDSSGIGSRLDFTNFQAGRTPVWIEPGESRVVRFRFNVPDTVRDGAYICAQVFVGEGRNPFFSTVGQRSLFCIEKGFVGFGLVAEKATQTLFRQSKGNAPGMGGEKLRRQGK